MLSGETADAQRWRPSSTPPRSTSARRRHGVVRLGAGHAAGADVCRRARSRWPPTRPTRRPRNRHGARGAPWRCACPPRRNSSSATSTGRPRSSRRPAPSRPHSATSTLSWSAGPSWRVLAMDRGRWAEAAEHLRACPRRPSMSPGCTTTPSSVPAFVGGRPARCAPRRPERGGPATRAGDAGPTVLHVRASPTSPCGSGCNWPRCTPPSATRRPHATSCGRSTTSCSTGRPWEPSSTKSRNSATILTAHTAHAEEAGGPPLTPAELRLLPYLQTHLTFREIGAAAVRVPQHRQLRSRLDLPETGRLVPQRRRATRDRDRPARRVVRDHRPAWYSKASSTS